MMCQVIEKEEEVVVEEGAGGNNKGNGDNDGTILVDCGVPNNLVRCVSSMYFVCFVPHSNRKGLMKGTAVSPTTPRDEEGMYWGYTTRLASSINAFFEEFPNEGGYAMKVGTSEHGDVSIDDVKFGLKRTSVKGGATAKLQNENSEAFDHLLIVFGGVAVFQHTVLLVDTRKPRRALHSTKDQWLLLLLMTIF